MNAEIDRLKQRQEELEHRLHAIRCDYHRGLDQDSEEQAVQLENMEVLQEIGRLAEEELAGIKQQLAELKQRH
jgi:predicted  nucleic acid-binding Zn-ribbon protein